MPCFHPLDAWRGAKLPSGKLSVVHDHTKSLGEWTKFQHQCGRCIGCRLERSRDWAVRCMHEATQWEDNCFVTLTYAPMYLPENGSLVKPHYQNFLKRLRQRMVRKGKTDPIRYYMCGEYGAELGRPHYHFCFFNLKFDDLGESFHDPRPFVQEQHRKVHAGIWEETKHGHPLYRSKTLEQLWDVGFSTIGGFSFETAAYCARYITKKITGDRPFKKKNGTWVDPKKHYNGKLPEFNQPSTGGGIGRGWYQKNKRDVYPSDNIILLRNGDTIKTKPPKFYDRLLELADPDEMKRIKLKRIQDAKEKGDEPRKRQFKKEELAKHRAKKLKRGYENE